MTTQHAACRAKAGLIALVLAAAGGQADATAVAGPGGINDPGRRPVTAATVATPAPGAVAPTLDLVAARLDAVDLSAGTVTVRGQRVPLHPSDLRVFDGGGRALGPSQLRAGQSVRLALEPLPTGMASPASAAAAAAGRRIVLIYIDA